MFTYKKLLIIGIAVVLAYPIFGRIFDQYNSRQEIVHVDVALAPAHQRVLADINAMGIRCRTLADVHKTSYDDQDKITAYLLESLLDPKDTLKFSVIAQTFERCEKIKEQHPELFQTFIDFKDPRASAMGFLSRFRSLDNVSSGIERVRTNTSVWRLIPHTRTLRKKFVD